MNLILTILSVIFSIYLTFELFRIYILKRDKNSLLVVLISLLSIGFGLVVLVNYGLIVDYGNPDLDNIEYAFFMVFLAWINIWIGLIAIGISIVKLIFQKLKKH